MKDKYTYRINTNRENAYFCVDCRSVCIATKPTKYANCPCGSYSIKEIIELSYKDNNKTLSRGFDIIE